MYNNIFYELFDAEEHDKFIKNVDRAYEIIDYHIELLKDILNTELGIHHDKR